MTSRLSPALLAIALLIPLATLAGCATTQPEVDESMTWQEAKKSAQQTENEIVALIPSDQIVTTTQGATGTLLSCDDTQYQWTGRTTVKLAPGADVEPLVTTIAEHYDENGDLTPEQYADINGDLTVQLIAHDGKENYLVGAGTKSAEELEVTSFSACFVLPDDVYPGGEF
ncbi:hypothetical protein [Agromyces sp. Leaf222]|uniref:hypothetical protein n=1 Tax=Agromyces sp. Leaf222 TaxID=1735688 RepID=UPI0006F1D277|nr:hypothetical protein [Agromyces sp. Leaf222]KQM82404.1 hypothetical protein ASE68_03150 [Agromyces sp. Leaf222]